MSEGISEPFPAEHFPSEFQYYKIIEGLTFLSVNNTILRFVHVNMMVKNQLGYTDGDTSLGKIHQHGK